MRFSRFTKACARAARRQCRSRSPTAVILNGCSSRTGRRRRIFGANGSRGLRRRRRSRGRTEDGRRRTEDRGQRTEGGGQRTEDRGRRTEGRALLDYSESRKSKYRKG